MLKRRSHCRVATGRLSVLLPMVLMAACREPSLPTTRTTTNDVVATASDFSVYMLPALWKNQGGDTLHLTALRGKVRVVAMVYTNCHTACPIIVAELKRIEAAVPASARDQVEYTLVSLDPTHDTPARLTEWAQSLELDLKHWTILTGGADAVRELAATLEVRYQILENSEIAHTNGLTVLDRDGHIVHQQVRLGESAETIDVINAQLK